MKVLLLVVLVLIVIGAILAWRRGSVAREQRHLDDARAEAQRWYERLGGQVMNLHGDDPATRQALADAGERYNAAGGQLQQAKTIRQYELARESALEGLAYVRAARVAMGLDPGAGPPGAGRLVFAAGVEDRAGRRRRCAGRLVHHGCVAVAGVR